MLLCSTFTTYITSGGIRGCILQKTYPVHPMNFLKKCTPELHLSQIDGATWPKRVIALRNSKCTDIDAATFPFF